MENRAYAIAVAIFTLLLALGLGFAYWWMSDSQEERTEYIVSSQLPVTGLNPETIVKFRGVNIGKVVDISLDTASQTTILIKIAVSKNLKLSNTAYAQLHRQGITGLAYIDLNDENKNGPALEAGSIIPLKPTLIDNLSTQGPELLAQFNLLLKNSEQLTASANQALKQIDIEKLNHTIANLEKASQKALPAIDSATVMFNNAGNMMSDKNQAQLMQTLNSLRQTSEATKPLIAEMSITAKSLHNTVDQIGNSTDQLATTLSHETLPQLQTLTQNMSRSVLHFNQLIDNLNDNPQSIIFGKQSQPAGPGEEGFNVKP